MFSSWRTSLMAIIGIAITVLTQAQNLVTGQPLDWEIILPLAPTWLQGFFARDNAVSSERAKVRR